MKALLATLALALLACTASADSVWNYQGNTVGAALAAPNLCGCALSGSVMLNDTNQAVAWNFTDGILSLDQSNSTASINPFEYPNGGGIFDQWRVVIEGIGADAGVLFFSQYYGSTFEATDSTTEGLYVQGNRGIWTDPPATTPEPGTLVLLAAGLVAVLLRKRRSPAISANWENLA